MTIPKTERLQARPVWARHLRRILRNTEELPYPTEKEQQDAIRVLEDPSNATIPGLWVEAHRILEES